MLFNLINRNKKKRNFLDSITIGFAPKIIPFDPITLPNFQAGYYINFTTDSPSGSIKPVLADRTWYDQKTKPAATKVLQINANTATTLVNGFKALDVTLIDYLFNGSIDAFTGVIDTTILIGFKRNIVSTGNYILFVRNAAGTIRLHFILLAGGKLQAYIQTGANAVSLVTVNNYDDNHYHTMVVTLNQTTKTMDLYTDLGEHLTGSNALMTMPLNFTPSAASNFTLANLNTFASPLKPGVLCDTIILNSVSSLAEINLLMKWECDRLGIPYVVF